MPPESAEMSSRPLVGEVIAIGDELTTGQRLDTNTQWLAQRLTEQGVDVRFHTTVADVQDANISVFRTAAQRADLVVTTGGLGPTADDLTRDALAEAAGVPLVEHADLLAAIEHRFTSRGREMPPQNRRQAQLPGGAAAIPNPGGTAPGVAMSIGGCRFFALPGVPAEMKEMWEATVLPAIESLGGPRRVVRHWLVKCFGAGESHVESLVPDLIARGREPLVGITASKATITLRVTASGPDETACYEAMQPTLQQIRKQLSDLIFAEQPGGGEEIGLHEVVIQMMSQRGVRLTATEGMTEGLLGHWLATADAKSCCVQGCSLLTERESDISALAGQMSRTTGYSLAIGFAGEDGQTPVALARDGQVTLIRPRLIGHPSIHRDLIAKHALNLLRLELMKES